MTCLSRLATVLLLAASAATAQDTEINRQSLKGLKGVYVLVESLQPGAERDGLNKTSIQTDVELKLRQAGIMVLTEAESFETPGAPHLYINLNTRSGSVYAFSINVRLRQTVRLDRDPSMQLSAVTTWSEEALGIIGRDNLREIRDYIKDYVDQFINAYLSVNPKK